MPWDDDISGIQREIASYSGSPIHVLAGPGTGKTWSMMRRICRLIESGITPQRILAVTFTRTAARDLKEQLNNLNVAGSELVKAATLHSLCYSILRKEEVFSITGRIPRPLLSYETKQLINDLSKYFGGKKKVKEFLEAYEAGWARLQRESAGSPLNEADEQFEELLLNWLRFHNSLLIGELVPLTLNFVRRNPAINVLPHFEHVLVDEYQDLNCADQALCTELARHGNFAVFGDDNQSIYMFRHANPEGIINFPKENDGTITYTIEDCYRCPTNIVQMSNSLIRKNPIRSRGVPLRSHNDENAEIYIVQHKTIEDEINSISDFISNYLDQNPGLPHGQVLVLATRRFIGHNIRNALIQRGLNSLSYFFEDELDSIAASEGFCLLYLIVKPYDTAALRAWIGIGHADGFSAGYSRIQKYAQENDIELKALLSNLANGNLSIPYTSKIIDRYNLLCQRLEEISGLKGLELVRNLWPPKIEKCLDLRILAENIAIDNPHPSSILESLLKEITQPELPSSDSDIIRIMSLHKSKGLSSSVVVIAGCVEGALPTLGKNISQNEKQKQIQEQRRLFYVAITRSKNILVISSPVRMTLRDAKSNGISIRKYVPIGGETYIDTFASQFISELGRFAPDTISTSEWRDLANF